jgi:hypothetical protein
MQAYHITNCENGDILLTLKTIEMGNYIIENIQEGKILLKKIPMIVINKIRDVRNYNFTKSTIIECTINNEFFDNKLCCPRD